METADAPRMVPRPGAGDLAWVSWLRVVAIAAVVLIHVGGITAKPLGSADGSSATALGTALDFASRWAVPVFVMVSGALLLEPAKYRDAGDFLRRRAVRLLPAVIFWHLVYLVYVEAALGPVSLHDVVQGVLTGTLYTALYFFWIVIGLAVVTPVLLPWVAMASPRARLTVALGALGVPMLALVTVPLRSDQVWTIDQSWVRTPWTWWLLYLGYYLLGRELRDVVVRGWWLALTALGAVGGSAWLILQWGRTGGLGEHLERVIPAEAYVGPVVAIVAVCVFLTVHALIRPGGLLAVLCRPGVARAGRRLGEATLGVYGVHLLVRNAVLALPGIGGNNVASSPAQLVARCVVVLLVAYLIALMAHRVPYMRRVV